MRISDADPAMLRYLAERGIAPGDPFEVIEKQPFGGPLFASFGDAVHVLGGRLADAMRVEVRGVSAPPPAALAAERSRRRRRRAAAARQRAARRSARRGRIRGRLAMLGPAFVAAVAYIDPGNFATNIAGGAKYGYLLVWVIIAANLMAMLVQYLSAKVGVATGRSLPELCRDALPRPVTWGLWVQAEIIAIATDLAEFVGAAIALNLLFGVPPFTAGLMTAAVAFGDPRAADARLPPLRARDRRPAGDRAARLRLRPLADRRRRRRASSAASCRGFQGTDSILIAVGILGATVMPHVVYLHSALTQARIQAENDDERRELMRFQRVDVMIAMGLAGRDQPDDADRRRPALPRRRPHRVDSIEGAHAGLETLLGGGAALAFAVALLASGLSSSSVGTYAGQVVMQGFINFRIPLFLRRAITMTPALDRARDGARRDLDARDLAGRAVVRHPVRARADDPADAPRRPDGRARQPPPHDRDRLARGRADHRAQRLPAVGDVLLG